MSARRSGSLKSLPSHPSTSSLTSSFTTISSQLSQGPSGVDETEVNNGILSLLDKISIPNTIFCRGPSSVSLAHYQQQDDWSCGYRNLQMVLSALIPNVYPEHPLFGIGRNSVPSIDDLQLLFEQSWKKGFDPEGSKYYKKKLRDTKSEIGALEVASLLSYLYVDNVVVQFEKSDKSSWDLMEKFVLHYFSKPCQCGVNEGYDFFDAEQSETTSDTVRQVLESVHEHGHECQLDKSISTTEHSDSDSWSSFASRCECFSSPLFLQWDGHSATIVGIEKTIIKKRNESKHVSRLSTKLQNQYYNEVKYNFLVFDPCKEVLSLKAGLKIAMKFGRFSSDIIEPLRMPLENIKGDRCQIIVCSTRPLSTPERKRSRRTFNAITVKS